MEIVVGTVDGLHRVGQDGVVPSALAGKRVTALAPDYERRRWLALTDGASLWAGPPDGPWEHLTDAGGRAATCLVAVGRGVLVGTGGAHLLWVGDGGAEPVSSFDRVDGRSAWYTPWGAPPDARSLSVALDGSVYVNVHVGGIVRSTDGTDSWQPTIDIDTDVHQVVAAGGDGSVLAATAYGLARSRDRGDTWDLATDGLHATYCRALALTGDDVVLSASTGPGGQRSALYRGSRRGGRMESCREGLPEWLPGNVDTGCLAAGVAGADVAFGTGDGSVWGSADAGRTWAQMAVGLPRVTCLTVVS